jgi:hypothetical protein
MWIPLEGPVGGCLQYSMRGSVEVNASQAVFIPPVAGIQYLFCAPPRYAVAFAPPRYAVAFAAPGQIEEDSW